MTIKTAIEQLLEVEQAKGESGNDNYCFMYSGLNLKFKKINLSSNANFLARRGLRINVFIASMNQIK